VAEKKSVSADLQIRTHQY